MSDDRTEDARVHALAARLQILIDQPEWLALADELSRIEEGWIEKLVKCSAKEHDFNSGMILGMRLVMSYPQTIIDASKKLRKA